MITVISNRRILNKATIGLMRIPHNITTKEEIRNMVSSKMHIKDHPSSRVIHHSSSNIPANKAIQDNSRVMVLPRVVQDLSIPIIHRDKDNSMGDTDPRSPGHHNHHSRGLTDMTRVNMEITNSEKVLTFR
ncbi:hypothetical protein EK904_007519 [Melospiza melodia maxima]|nr:hypothetical protein EK904_007519 [Melospiza melodia maxima]